MSVLSTADPAFITKLTEIITANLGNASFGAKELAQEAGLSRPRLNRKLLRVIGKTATQFILNTRLGISMQILRSDDITAAEVAYKTGFSSPAYFNTCFHKHFGYTPGKVKVSEDKLQKDSIYVRGKRSAMRKYIYILSGVLILMASGYVIHFARSGAPEKSIAVVPFRNLSSEITDQYIYDGIMDEIFNNLSKVHMLRVVSRNSVEQYRNTARATTDIARELNVNYIIVGSGQKVGNTFCLRVQLIEVRNKKEIDLWADSFEQEILKSRELFRIQSQTAQSIVSALKATLTVDEKKLIEKIPTQEIIAYRLYQKANDYRKDFEVTYDQDSYQIAVNLYTASLAIDSTFARAYTGLALSYWSRYFAETYFKTDFLDSCIILADKAISLDSKLDEAFFIKANYFRQKGQVEEALENYDKALKINPNYATAYINRGIILAFILYDYVSSLDNIHKALDLTRGNDRISAMYHLVNLYANCGFLEKAKYYLEELLKLDGDSSRYLYHISWQEFSQEHFEEALNLRMRAERIDSTYYADGFMYNLAPGHLREAYTNALRSLDYYKKSGKVNVELCHIGYTFQQVGKYEEAEYYYSQHIKNCEEMIRLNREGGQRKFAQYDLACIYAVKGDKEKAFRYLEEYGNRKYSRPFEISLLKNDPMFDNIRQDERFQSIVEKMKARYQQEHERVSKWLEEQRML